MRFTNKDTGETIDIDFDKLLQKGIRNRDNTLHPKHKFPKPLPEDVIKKVIKYV